MNLVLPAMLLTGIRLCADLMCELLIWTVSDVRWPETISALASIVTAVIAYLALQTWKQQDKARVRAEFLDSLVEAAHAFIAEIHKPIMLLEIARIGIKAHRPASSGTDTAEVSPEGAVAYIKKYGDQHGKRMLEELGSMQPIVIKLRSLAAKGQVYKFDGYARCYNAVAVLTSHFDRLEAFTAMIISSSMNWENPEARALLEKVIAVDENEMRDSVRTNNLELLEFARLVYEKIYS